MKKRNNLKIKKEFMDRVFLPLVCKEERQLGLLTGVQVEVARNLVTKAKSVAQKSQVYKRRIVDLEDEVGELPAYVQVMEEKVAMSLNKCTDITDKHRDCEVLPKRHPSNGEGDKRLGGKISRTVSLESAMK